MSLNQLSEEMWEKLDYSSVDSSVLSRVLKEKDCLLQISSSFLQYILRNNWQEEMNFLIYKQMNIHSIWLERYD